VKIEKISPADSSETRAASPAKDEVQANWERVVRRRSFLHGLGAAGVVAGAAALPSGKLFAQNERFSKGDAAILRLARGDRVYRG
jgi:hypothetical protein